MLLCLHMRIAREIRSHMPPIKTSQSFIQSAQNPCRTLTLNLSVLFPTLVVAVEDFVTLFQPVLSMKPSFRCSKHTSGMDASQAVQHLEPRLRDAIGNMHAR